MNRDLSLLRDLQRVDKRIHELNEEVRRLPKYVAEIEAKLNSHKQQLEADKQTLADNQKSRRQTESDIATHEQKIARLRDQMNEARTNEQYHAFQHEIQFEQTEIRKLEDRILDKMEEAESIEGNVKKAAEALKIETQKVQREVSETKARVAEDERVLGEQKERRDKLAGEVSPDALRLYEQVRRAHGGTAVAAALADRCQNCNVVFRPQFSYQVRSNESIMTCESCGLILYYEPPGAGLEDPAGDAGIAGG
jgi:predicted  nucleic acid-binding Zn-ribbon protein